MQLTAVSVLAGTLARSLKFGLCRHSDGLPIAMPGKRKGLNLHIIGHRNRFQITFSLVFIQYAVLYLAQII